MKRSVWPVLVLVLALAASAGLKMGNDRIARRKIPGSSIIYIPSGKYLKPMTFGHPSLVADILFIWAIQYYGNPAIPGKFEHFTHIFSIIADLDPRYIDPYEIGSLIALYDAKDLTLAIKILDMGLERNPDRWIFPFQAGHYALLAKDFDTAKIYFKKAMDIPGSPPIAKRLYGNAAYKTLDYQTAWATWKEVYETASEDEIRKIASNHLYNIKSTVDIAALKNAVFDFRARFGRNPAALDELVRSGFLRAVPRDFDDKEYLYDPVSGGITTRVNPWKR